MSGCRDAIGGIQGLPVMANFRLIRTSVVLLFSSVLSWGQQATGTITGTVTDPQNAVVPG